MVDNIILNKVTTIERCIERIREEYDEKTFEQNYTKQDSVILNIQRACEAIIDIGTRIIKIKSLAAPNAARDVFIKLAEAEIIPVELSETLQKLVGFRNIAVHDYTRLELPVDHAIVKNGLEDMIRFNQLVLKIN